MSFLLPPFHPHVYVAKLNSSSSHESTPLPGSPTQDPFSDRAIAPHPAHLLLWHLLNLFPHFTVTPRTPMASCYPITSPFPNFPCCPAGREPHNHLTHLYHEVGLTFLSRLPHWSCQTLQKKVIKACWWDCEIGALQLWVSALIPLMYVHHFLLKS